MAAEAAAVERVDVGALTAAIRNEATRRVAGLLESSITALDEQDRPLNELQRSELVDTAIVYFDGFEREVAKEIVRAFKGTAELWGLPDHLEDVLREASV